MLDIEDWLDELAVNAKRDAPEDLSRLTTPELRALLACALRVYAISGNRDTLCDDVQRWIEKRDELNNDWAAFQAARA